MVTVCVKGKNSLITADWTYDSGFETYNLQGSMKGWSLSSSTGSIVFDDFKTVLFKATGKGCLSYRVISGLYTLLKEVANNTPLLKENHNGFVQSLVKRIPNPQGNYWKIEAMNISGDFGDINPVDPEVGKKVMP